MEDSTLSKNTESFGLSLALCAVLNALLVIAKEKSKGVQDWMQKMTGHHWITHVIIVLVAFLLFGLLFRSASRNQISAGRLTNIIFVGVVLGALIIGGFYLIAD